MWWTLVFWRCALLQNRIVDGLLGRFEKPYHPNGAQTSSPLFYYVKDVKRWFVLIPLLVFQFHFAGNLTSLHAPSICTGYIHKIMNNHLFFVNLHIFTIFISIQMLNSEQTKKKRLLLVFISHVWRIRIATATHNIHLKPKLEINGWELHWTAFFLLLLLIRARFLFAFIEKWLTSEYTFSVCLLLVCRTFCDSLHLTYS